MKIKSPLLIAAVLSVSATASVFAASDYSPSHLKSLSDSILEKQPVEAWQDINSDGRIDSLDMVALRQALLSSTGEFSESTIPATEEYMRFTGRNFLGYHDAAWLVQSGSAAEFVVTGKSAKVQIFKDNFGGSTTDNAPRFAVLVDGEIVLDSQILDESEEVTIFEGETSRTAVVKIIHLSEANNGAVGVGNLTVVSDSAIPVAPTQKKDISIEFIGDSITCAYGVEGASQYEGFKTSTENFMKSYAYLTAQKLNADYSAVSYSGYGIVSGYTSGDTRNKDAILPDWYKYIGRQTLYRKEWDFSANKNDVVVINLGTNDDSYASKNLEERGPEYAEGYEKFLYDVHEKNPDAYIICTLGTMGCTELYPYIEQAVAAFKAETGYDRIMSYQSVTHTQADGFGSDWHPSEKTQLNSSYTLADKICQALGLESDQIGLDVAVDAEYTAEQYDGAMMSAYFSDWDKSFHITTVYGGTSRESIKAFISGIDMKKDGKYSLTFKCETTEGEEIPFTLKTADGQTIFEDSFKGTGTKGEYSAEFTSDKTDKAAVLEFQMGGKDSLRLSLYEVKMTKIG